MLTAKYLGRRVMRGIGIHLLRVEADTKEIVIVTEGGTRMEKRNFSGAGTFAVVDVPKKKGVIAVYAGKEKTEVQTE